LFRSVLSAHPILYTPGSASGFEWLVHPPGALAFVPVLETRRDHLHHALPASLHGWHLRGLRGSLGLRAVQLRAPTVWVWGHVFPALLPRLGRPRRVRHSYTGNYW